MPKDKDQNAEPNTSVVRIRMTPTMRKAFDDYCERQNISEASAGRLGIYNLIGESHKKATGQRLEVPDVNPQNWAKKS